MLNKKLLKNLLTTTSAMALISGITTSANADEYLVTGNATIRQDEGSGNTTNIDTGEGSWSAGDSLRFEELHSLRTGDAGDVTIGDLYLNYNGEAADIKVAQNKTIISNITASDLSESSALANITLLESAELQIKGVDLFRLGTIDGNSTKGNEAKLTFSGEVIYGRVGDIGSNHPLYLMQIDGGGVFVNKVTATTINVNTNTTFLNVVTATEVDIAASTTLSADGIFNSKGVKLSEDSVFTVNGNIEGGGNIDATGDNFGTVTFNSKVSAGAVGDIGITDSTDSKALRLVVIAGDNSSFSSKIAANELRINAKNVAINGAITTPNLNISNKNSLTTGAGLLTLNGKATLYPESVLTIGKGGIAGGGKINATGDKIGTVTFNSKVSDGAVGEIGITDSHPVGLVVVGKDASSSVFSSKIAASELRIEAADVSIKGAITTPNLNIRSDGALTTGAGLLTLEGEATLYPGSVLTIGEGGITGNQDIVDSEAYAGTVIFNNVVKSGDVNRVGSGPRFLGVIQINGKGASTFNGHLHASTITIGENSKGSIFNGVVQGAYLNFNGDNTTLSKVQSDGGGPIYIAAGKTVTVNDYLHGNGIYLGKGSTLIIGTSASKSSGKVNGLASDGDGAIIFNNSINADEVGTIGDTKRLGSVTINGKSEFNNSINADEVTVNAETLFSADLTANTKLTIEAGKTATINSNVTIASALNHYGTIILGDDGSIINNGTTSGVGSIDGAGSGKGSLKFNAVVGDGYTGNIGATQKLNLVTVSGVGDDDNLFKGQIKTNTLTVTKGANIETKANVVAEEINIDDLIFLVDAEIEGNVTFTADGSLKIASTGSMTGGTISTNAEGTGTVEFNSKVESETLGAIGATKALNEVIVKNDATFDSSLSSKTLTLATNNITTIKNDFNVSTVNFTSESAKLDLGSADEYSIIIGKITTGTTKQGDLEFNNKFVADNIGPIGTKDAMIRNINVNRAEAYSFTSPVYTDIFTVNNSGATVHSNSKINIGSQLLFTQDGTFIFDAADTANVSDIATTSKYSGTVIFNGPVIAKDGSKGVGDIGKTGMCAVKAIEVNYKGDNVFSGEIYTETLTLGAGANLKSNDSVTAPNLSIDSGDCVANNTLTVSTNTNFTADGSLIVTKDGSLTGGGTITTSDAGTGSVVFNRLVDEGEVGEIGASGESIKALTVNASGDNTFSYPIFAQTVTLGTKSSNMVAGNITAETLLTFVDDSTLTASGATYLPVITTSKAGAGSIVFNDRVRALDPESYRGIGDVGTKANPLKDITFKAADTNVLSGDIYANAINLDDNAAVVTLDIQQFVASNITLKTTVDGKGHIVNVNNATLEGDIYTQTDNRGKVTFNVNSTMVGDIGTLDKSVYEVAIEEDSNATINGKVYTGSFYNYSTLTLGGDVTISSKIHAANNSTIDLKSRHLTALGLVLPSGESMNLQFGTQNSTMILTHGIIAGCELAEDSTIKANLSLEALPKAGNKLNLLVATVTSDDQATKMETYMRNQIKLTAPDSPLITLSDTVNFSADGYELTAYATTSAPSYEELTSSRYGVLNNSYVQPALNRLFAGYAKDGGVNAGEIEKQYFIDAGLLTPEKAEELFVTLSTTPLINTIAISHAAAHNDIVNNISSRIAIAGDEGHKMGVWAQGFGATATQKARQNDVGFKSNSMGVTVGADTEITDNSLLGIAASFSSSDTKLKDQLSGGKIKAKTYGASLYGSYNIDNWVLQGSLSVSKAKSTVNTTGKAKFSSTNFGAKGIVGYKHQISDFTLTPMVGLNYARYGKSNATETGVYSRDIKVNALNKLSAIIGAKLATQVGEFTPEVHGFMDYNITRKAQSATVGLGSDATVNIATPHAKPVRTTFNLGTSVTGTNDNIEYGIGYDATLATKYIAHQGSIKVRFNF